MITTFGTSRQALALLEFFIKETFSKYSERKLAVAVVRSLDDLKSFSKTQTEKLKLDFPFIQLVIASYAIDLPKSKSKLDLKIANDETGKTTLLRKLPIKLGIGARFQSDSQEEILNFCHGLALAYPSVSFELNYGNFKHPVNIQIEPQYTIPSASLSAPGDPFILETTFILSLIEGDMSTMPSIKTINMNISDISIGLDDKVIETIFIKGK